MTPPFKPRREVPRKKPLRFVGSALKDLRALPPAVQDIAGRLLLDVQYGDTPPNVKPMEHIGSGTIQLEITAAQSWFRVFYVTKPEAVYVLHVFNKTSNKTSRADNEKGVARYRQLSEYRDPPP